MQEVLEQNKLESLALCDRLLTKLEENKEDACSFFGGEMYQTYNTVTDRAKHKVQTIKSKIRNL